MMDWRLYYANQTTFDPDNGEWSDAPSRGILAITTRSPQVGREVIHGYDYYLWWPDAPYPWGVDKAGLWDFLREIDHSLADQRLDNEDFAELEALGVKFGRSVSTEDYQERLAWILADPDFPPKSAKTLREQV